MKQKRMVKIIIGDGSPMKTYKPDRNKLCQCGSGLKQKKCCGNDTKFFSTKPKPKPDMSHIIQESIDNKYPAS